MGSITKLGKKWYTVLRDNGTSGEWVDGEWIPAGKKEVKVFANVQASFSMKHSLLLPESDRSKQFIWGSSDHWVYTAESGVENILEADVIIYLGTKWEIKGIMPYTNFGQHVEFVATKVDGEARLRTEGLVNDF